MTNDFFIVNAFTQRTFGGNPAVVCPLSEWLDDAVMQSMAAQHNLSETAFLVATPDSESDYHIRWFTPTCEVELCGHATLAASHVLYHELGYTNASLRLQSQVGILTINQETDGKLAMNFPKGNVNKSAVLGTFHAVFGNRPQDAYECPVVDGGALDLVLVFDDVDKVVNAQINLRAMHTLNYRCIIIAAADDSVDFICRVFAPKVGIDEDPVTGSAFTLLAPIWAERFAESGQPKTAFVAKQVSARGGDVWCALDDDRVSVSGYAKLYGKGQLDLA